MDGFLHLFASQIISRGLTFGLNLLSTRSLTPQAYGVVAIQLHLINTTLLFVSREGLRRGCLRIDPARPGLAAVVELTAEPLYILATVRRRYSLRVGVEAAAQLGKSGAVALLLAMPGTDPVVAFSLGQVVYAGVTLLGYIAASLDALFRRRGTQEQGPRPAGAAVPSTGLGLDPVALHLSMLFGLQALSKLVLAEGSKFALAALRSSYDQGVVGLVTNLGSLVVRTVFQPFEEAAFLAFSAAAAAAAAPLDEGLASRGGGGVEELQDEHSRSMPNGKTAVQDSPAAPTASPHGAPMHRAVSRLLPLMLRCMLTFSLTAAAFAPAYSYLALLAAYGSTWASSSAPLVLAAYALTLPLMAANGVLEACVHGSTDARQLARANAALTAASVAHVAALLAGTATLGTAGLLLADAAIMALRIAYCLAFIRREAGVSLRTLWPRRPTLAALCIASGVTCVSRMLLLPESSTLVAAAAAAVTVPGLAVAAGAVTATTARHALAVRAAAHAAVGAACLAGVAGVALRSEGDALRQLRAMRKGDKAE